MKQASLVTLLLAICAVAGFLSFRLLTGTASLPAVDTPAPVDQLPEFTLNTVDNERRSIHDYLGQPMVLNFWATWCPPCVREIPLLIELQHEAGDALQVVGVAIDRQEPVLEFIEELGINYPVLIGEQEAIDAASAFGETFLGLPFTVFTDGQGRVLGLHMGELMAEDLLPVRRELTRLARGETTVEAVREALDRQPGGWARE